MDNTIWAWYHIISGSSYDNFYQYWNFKKQFAFALDILDKTDDSNDLDLKIKEYFNGRSFESNIAGSKQYFYIAPYTENHLKLKLYFPTKLYWISISAS